MPFEPRLFEEGDKSKRRVAPPADFSRPPSEPVWDDAEQLELPGDLAMLADQLRDDAVYLAQRHPADATVEQREAAWRSHTQGEKKPPRKSALPFRWRWISTAAALVIAVTGGWALWHFSHREVSEPNSIAVTSPESLPVPSRERRLETDAPRREVVAQPADVHENRAGVGELPSLRPRLIPAAFLRDISAPELQGVLDLLEQDEAEPSIFESGLEI